MQKKLLLLLCFLIPACAARNVGFHYEPEVKSISLWNDEKIPLESDWSYLSSNTFSVRGALWNSFLPVTDTMDTILFTRTTQNAPEVLIISRVIKTTTANIFILLGGDKSQLGNRTYRQARYELSANSADPEYSRYIEALRAADVIVAPSYQVDVWDRLPLDSVLVRIMHLRPGMSSRSLPAYAQLYPQERDEPIFRIRD